MAQLLSAPIPAIVFIFVVMFTAHLGVDMLNALLIAMTVALGVVHSLLTMRLL